MVRSLIYFLVILIFFTLSPRPVDASQPMNSYFSMVRDYLLVFTLIGTQRQPILGLHTEPTKTPSKQHQANPPRSNYLLNAVNTYRASHGLGPVQLSDQVCAFAATRAQEIANNFSHEGFNTRISNHTLPYLTWSRATENIAETADYKQVVTLWANSPGHAANMRDDTPYVCIRQYGNFYAYEGMRP